MFNLKSLFSFPIIVMVIVISLFLILNISKNARTETYQDPRPTYPPKEIAIPYPSPEKPITHTFTTGDSWQRYTLPNSTVSVLLPPKQTVIENIYSTSSDIEVSDMPRDSYGSFLDQGILAKNPTAGMMPGEFDILNNGFEMRLGQSHLDSQTMDQLISSDQSDHAQKITINGVTGYKRIHEGQIDSYKNKGVWLDVFQNNMQYSLTMKYRSDTTTYSGFPDKIISSLKFN